MSTVLSPKPTVTVDSVATPASPLKQTVWFAGHQSIHIPSSLKDLASFRRWGQSDQCPEKVRICYLQREVWVDLTMEQAFSHNRLKTVVTAVFESLISANDWGEFFSDGMHLSNIPADFSTEPDGMFVSHAAFAACRVRLIEGKQGGFVEVEGTPDMVLEVVSDSTVQKDNQILRDLYWRAGIPEFWLMDARGESLVFDILRHASKGYTAQRKPGGWVKSSVFGKAFQLRQQRGRLGHPKFTLAVK